MLTFPGVDNPPVHSTALPIQRLAETKGEMAARMDHDMGGTDLEKTAPGNGNSSDSDHAVPTYSKGDGEIYDDKKPSLLTRAGFTAESFKRQRADRPAELSQSLKKRHLHMIAIGGSIGAGLFVGSGSALSRGGPASLLLDFGIIGVMIFNVGQWFNEGCISNKDR